jgi:adenylate cyclase
VNPTRRQPPDEARLTWSYDDAMPPADDVRSVGEQAIASLRRSGSERLAQLLRSDRALAANAAEVGLVDRAWLDDPASNPIGTAPPVEVVQRFLERSAEQRPSILSSIGLTAIQVMSLARSAPVEPVSTPITVMFTDLEGFTRYTARAGDEAAAAVVARHQRAVGAIVRSRGGRVVKHLGDGLMLSFLTPESAVLAAVELLTIDPDPLRLRAGIHQGEALVVRDDVVGHVVNVAARITEQADGGVALVSVDVRDAVGDLPGVAFGRARRLRLKGVDPISVCSVRSGR